MRSTSCVYVDTGYLLSSAATRVTGTSLRSGINVDYPLLIDSLIRTADDLSGLPTLRTYWYDSATNGVPNTQQERIGELSKVKLRLGRFGMNGEQKGVDLRIGLDLVTHARHTASDVFFLVSGDDDLTEAVEEAQGHGVEVVVLAVPDSHGRPHGISRHLLRAADGMHVLDPSLVDAAIIKIDRHPTAADAQNSDLSLPRLTDVPKPGPRPAPKPSPTPSTPPAEVPVSAPSASTTPAPSPLDVPASGRTPSRPVAGTLAYSSSTGQGSHVMPGYDAGDDDVLEPIAQRVLTSFLDTATSADLGALAAARPSIPRDIDRALLFDASDAFDMDDLGETVRHRLRAVFWECYDAR